MENQEILTPETEETENSLYKQNPEANIKKNYILKLNSIPYHFSIELSSNNYFNFELRQADKISYDYYSSKYNYEDILNLLHLEKKIYNNTLKVIELFENLLKKKKIFIHKDSNKRIIALHIKLEQNSLEQEYTLYLEIKIMTEKKMMSILIDEINEMKTSKNPKNDSKEVDEDANSLEDELKNIEEQLNKLNSKKEEIQKKLNQNYHNSIMNLNDDENIIIIPIKIVNDQVEKRFKFLNSERIDTKNIIIFINGIKHNSYYNFYPGGVGFYTVIIKFKNKTNNCEKLFYDCRGITEIDLSHFKADSVTSMESMFENCVNLQKVNFSSFDTKNVINMKAMFKNCENLKELNLSSFNTKNVINMEEMFMYCDNLKKLNLSSFDTNKVINMERMFRSCLNLKELNISSFKTHKVKSMKEMFKYCTRFQEFNLSSFDTQNVENMREMFYSCYNLVNLDLSSFNYDKVKDLEDIFGNCYNLNKIKINKNSEKIKEFVYENYIKLEVIVK